MEQRSSSQTPTATAATSFLCVDAFLGTLVAARALHTALEIGLIDCLALESAFADVEAELGIDRRGLVILIQLLEDNHVLQTSGGKIKLTAAFQEALRYRDLLEAKIDFAQIVTPDVLQNFTALIVDPREFQRTARVFQLFDYRRCFDDTPENRDRTRKWMRLTTCLTRYETRACMDSYPWCRHRRLLDIGGNSGEFALQLCKRYPELQAVVFDLPIVCDLGREHVTPEPESSRIQFIKGNALIDAWPGGFDLITFKSFLHDWPESEARRLLAKASNALAPGGTLLILERGPMPATSSYAMISFLPFFRSFRHPQFYEEQMARVGLGAVQTQEIQLEMKFYLVTGSLAAAR